MVLPVLLGHQETLELRESQIYVARRASKAIQDAQVDLVDPVT